LCACAGWNWKRTETTKPKKSVGTGVVVVDKGIILTNLHVVAGARLVRVVFADGLQSDAAVISVHPEQDLAVLQAKTIQTIYRGHLQSTGTLHWETRSLRGLPVRHRPVGVGRVVSGLGREYISPEGKRLLTNLIQFDRPPIRNSGGPLVTADGEMVGIVTAILNPTEQRVFIGIGFAVTMESAAAAVGLPPFRSVVKKCRDIWKIRSEPLRAFLSDGARALRDQKGRCRPDHFLERCWWLSWPRGICS